jgi:hypothetical protein
VITALYGDLCDVTLDTDENRDIWIDDIRLPINQTPTLTAVPIRYMTCNGAAFAVDDHVVVEFRGDGNTTLWTQPRVIGFVDHPQPCQTVFITDPSSDSDTDGSRAVLQYAAGTGWYASANQSALEYGNCDWVNTAGDVRLSWWGSPSRYFTYSIYEDSSSGFSTIVKHGAIYRDDNLIAVNTQFWRVTGADSGTKTELFRSQIYKGGASIGAAPKRVFGLGVAIDPADSANVWLIAICGDDPGSGGHDSPGAVVYATAWSGGSVASATWSTLDTYSFTGTNTNFDSRGTRFTQNVTPWFGRGDGLLYKSIKFDTDGHYIFSVTVSFPTPSAAPAGAITKGALAWGSNPEIQAIDYVGATEWRLEDDLTTIELTDGTTSYTVLDATERSNPAVDDPIYTVAACDLRAKAFLLERVTLDSGGVPNGRDILIRMVDPVFEFQLE